jgi:Tfp pilus assembly major pilin PilA
MLKKSALFLIGILIALPIVGTLVGIKIKQFQTMAEVGAAMQMPAEVVNAIEVQSPPPAADAAANRLNRGGAERRGQYGGRGRGARHPL